MTQPQDLDDATRARIRAEELEHAKVREEIAAETRVRNRPGYWTGALLNVLIIGAGFMYLGRVGTGIFWLLVALALAFATTPLLSWPLLVVITYFHYDSIYGRLYASPEERAGDARQGRLTWWLLGGIALLLGLFFLLAPHLL